LNQICFLDWCVTEGCSPICQPQQGEKLPAPEELTKKFLDRILDYMTRPVSRCVSSELNTVIAEANNFADTTVNCGHFPAITSATLRSYPCIFLHSTSSD